MITAFYCVTLSSVVTEVLWSTSNTFFILHVFTASGLVNYLVLLLLCLSMLAVFIIIRHKIVFEQCLSLCISDLSKTVTSGQGVMCKLQDCRTSLAAKKTQNPSILIIQGGVKYPQINLISRECYFYQLGNFSCRYFEAYEW